MVLMECFRLGRCCVNGWRERWKPAGLLRASCLSTSCFEAASLRPCMPMLASYAALCQVRSTFGCTYSKIPDATAVLPVHCIPPSFRCTGRLATCSRVLPRTALTSTSRLKGILRRFPTPLMTACSSLHTCLCMGRPASIEHTNVDTACRCFDVRPARGLAGHCKAQMSI